LRALRRRDEILKSRGIRTTQPQPQTDGKETAQS